MKLARTIDVSKLPDGKYKIDTVGAGDDGMEAKGEYKEGFTITRGRISIFTGDAMETAKWLRDNCPDPSAAMGVIAMFAEKSNGTEAIDKKEKPKEFFRIMCKVEKVEFRIKKRKAPNTAKADALIKKLPQDQWQTVDGELRASFKDNEHDRALLAELCNLFPNLYGATFEMFDKETTLDQVREFIG